MAATLGRARGPMRPEQWPTLPAQNEVTQGFDVRMGLADREPPYLFLLLRRRLAALEDS